MGDLIALDRAAMDSAIQRYNDLDQATQRHVVDCIDGRDTLNALGAATLRDLEDSGLIETVSGEGWGWTGVGLVALLRDREKGGHRA